MRINSKHINTKNHCFVGITWQFRNCDVEMHDDGFSCTCKKNLRDRCDHIKSVELGLLGVMEYSR